MLSDNQEEVKKNPLGIRRVISSSPSVPSLVLTGKETSACKVMRKGMGLKKCSPGNPASA